MFYGIELSPRWWTGSGVIEAYLGGQLASFNALMLLVGSVGL